MASLVIGAAILAFTTLRAGEALLPVLGQRRNDVFDLAWPLSLWVLWLVALYLLVPSTALVEPARQSTALAVSVAAISLLFGVRVARVWRYMRRR